MIWPDIKKYLNLHIKAQFDKDPEITARQVKKWLLIGHQPVDLSAIKNNTLSHFISYQLSYQLKKLTDSGSLERLRGSGGQNKTPPRVVARIKSLIKTRKMMVRNLISSIPNRLQTVIDLKSRQINKEDFKSLVIYDLLCKTFMFGNFYVVRNFFS